MIKQKTEKNTTEHSEHNHFQWECDIRLHFEGFFLHCGGRVPLNRITCACHKAHLINVTEKCHVEIILDAN